MRPTLRRLRADESGATAIEYSLIAAGIALAILAAVRTTGAELVALLQQLLTLWPIIAIG
jgi:pilus assembly protein Flp/PilA